MARLFNPFRSMIFRICVFSLLGTGIIFSLLVVQSWMNVYESRDEGWQLASHKFVATDREDQGIDTFRPVVALSRRMPTIADVPLLSAKDADDLLHEAELVLGVQVGEQSRAYPINVLTGPEREIINDHLGGRAIAATW